MTPDVVVVDLDREQPPDFDVARPDIVVGVGVIDHPGCDVVVDGPALVDVINERVRANPVASLAFVQLLRSGSDLLAESAVYSTLQAGAEFAAWRAGRPSKRGRDDSEAVALERDGDVLTITLKRPDVRNALNTAMRDQLCEAFDLVACDPSITEVHLRGEGESFCAGGDLDEFGSFPDPATAHLVRLQQSVGRRIDAVAERVTAHLHGASFGSGIELPAFAGTVVADPSTVIALPEVSLGLIPGAGGTVSLPRRIGRHRTARLGLTGERIDAETALAWGLVDAIG